MKSLNFTLVTEGSSDQALIPHLRWLLQQNGIENPIESTWADLRRLPRNIDTRGLIKKISLSVELYSSHLLFIHRDTDRETIATRKEEIFAAVEQVAEKLRPEIFVCVIPVRMTEAWLLFDEDAIRRASGNHNGDMPLNLPRLRDIEDIADPKEMLNAKLKIASGKVGRRLKKFNISHSVTQISEYIEDFAPLRELDAFQELETDIQNIIARINEINQVI